MAEPIIRVRNLKKQFVQHGDHAPNLKTTLVRLGRRKKSKPNYITIMDDVSFDIYPGEVVGVLGRNGTGKSSLFRILSGIYEADSGDLEVRGKLVPLVGLGAGFHQELTGYENIFLNGAVIGFSRREIMAKVDEIIAFSELGSKGHEPVNRYSSGMVVRLGFSIAVHLDAPILLLDEIFGVGDEGFQRKSTNKVLELIKSGRTIVMVSHDAAAVRAHCSRCLLFDQGKLLYDGDSAGGVEAYHGLFRGAGDV
jgi:ABC-type polysaccharide/polyol phosphate transport system ATPase subunit